MRHKYDTFCVVLYSVFDGAKGGDDSLIVRNFSFFHRHVEVDSEM